jgi:hypothetical protein
VLPVVLIISQRDRQCTLPGLQNHSRGSKFAQTDLYDLSLVIENDSDGGYMKQAIPQSSARPPPLRIESQWGGRF